jgi:hypothetical protein
MYTQSYELEKSLRTLFRKGKESPINNVRLIGEETTRKIQHMMEHRLRLMVNLPDQVAKRLQADPDIVQGESEGDWELQESGELPPVVTAYLRRVKREMEEVYLDTFRLPLSPVDMEAALSHEGLRKMCGFGNSHDCDAYARLAIVACSFK